MNVGQCYIGTKETDAISAKKQNKTKQKLQLVLEKKVGPKVQTKKKAR